MSCCKCYAGCESEAYNDDLCYHCTKNGCTSYKDIEKVERERVD